MSKLDPKTLEKVAETFRAFSEPVRLAILQELKSGPKTVGALVEALPTSQANISKHLKVMHEAQFLSREKQATTVVYAIDTDLAITLYDLVCTHLNRCAQFGPAPTSQAFPRGNEMPAFS